MSESSEEQIRHQTMMVKMVKKDLKRSITLDWGNVCWWRTRGIRHLWRDWTRDYHGELGSTYHT